MKSKKELIITLVGAAALIGTACFVTGCSGDTATIDEIASSFFLMEDKSGCLSCFGCVNRSSPADCTGTPKYSYVGCIDCFGITTSEETKPNDISAAVYICNGCYCVNMGAEEDGKVTPIYGCYKKN